MKITSSAFTNYGVIPQQYTCEGEGENPPLEIDNIPPDAKSLVLIVDDPDVPGGLFTHWVLWNITPDTLSIDEGSVPPGALEGENSTGEIGWIAPCPPTGTHHYRFQVFALSKLLSFPEGATRDEVESDMAQFVITRAELVGQYQKVSPQTS